jgi:hypothetical protein
MFDVPPTTDKMTAVLGVVLNIFIWFGIGTMWYGFKTGHTIMIISAIIGIVICFTGIGAIVAVILNIIWTIKIFLTNQPLIMG